MTSSQTYREIVLLSLAHLGFHDMKEIGMMTLSEFYLRLEAHQLHEVDVRERIAMQAWFNQTVQATTGKKNPRPKYTKFKQFFDREEQELTIRNTFNDDSFGISEKAKRHSSAEIFMRKVREFKELKAAGRIDPNAWKRARKEGDWI